MSGVSGEAEDGPGASGPPEGSRDGWSGAPPPTRRGRLSRILVPLKNLFQGQLAEERPRFVIWVPVIFGAGIWAYFTLKAEPGYPAAVLPLAMGLVAIALSSSATGRRLLAVMLVIAGLGFLTAKIRTALVAAPVLDRTLRAAELTGVLERREPHAKRGERLTLRLTSIAGIETQNMPRRARVRILGPAGDVKPGDRLRLTATLSPPAAPALPGGYDFARAAYFEQIGAVGYALKPPEKLVQDGPEPPPALRIRAAVEDIRQDIGRRIQAALP
ncbi:MAG: ComEC/Rec2 family competence protein, partial [Deltaproteobacteria bacterium]